MRLGKLLALFGDALRGKVSRCPVLRGYVLICEVMYGLVAHGVKNLNKNFKRIEVKIKGLTPLLMNRLNLESLQSKGRRRTESYDPKEEAAKSAYIDVIDGKRQLYIPCEAVYSMIINTSKQYRVRRMSLSSLLAGTMRIEPEKIPLGTDKYEVDVRAVVIQRQRVLKGRAKVPQWEATFFIIYDAERLPTGIDKILYKILDDAGTRMGLLDYRPQHKGWFGTFTIEKFVSDGIDLVKEEEKS